MADMSCPRTRDQSRSLDLLSYGQSPGWEYRFSAANSSKQVVIVMTSASRVSRAARAGRHVANRGASRAACAVGSGRPMAGASASVRQEVPQGRLEFRVAEGEARPQQP